MIAEIRARAGRWFLLAIGIALTTTAGHATARMMATHIALERPRFAFELALSIALLVVAVHIAAFHFAKPLGQAPGRAAGSTHTPPELMLQAPDALLGPPAPSIAQLKLPAGLRLESNEAIMITSGGHPERRILHVNAAFSRLTGFEPSEWIGQSGDLLLADGPLKMESLLWLDAAEDGRELHWIARLHRRDGTPFCGEAHLHPVACKDGGIGHVVLVMSDVTRGTAAGKSRHSSREDLVAGAGIRRSA